MKAVKGLVALALLGLLGWSFSKQLLAGKMTESLPIRYVRAEGVFQYLSKDEIKTALMPLVMTNIFDADMQKIQSTVMQLPWVKNAAVERVWPDAIDIKVQERKAYVRWGENGLLTENGELFSPANASQFQSLLLLQGPKEQEAKTLEIMKGVKTALADQALEMTEFSVNDREAWAIKLNTGLQILLGNAGQLKKLQRFLSTLSVLRQDRIAAMEIVDLRYPNGFAVSWRPDAQAIDWGLPKAPE